MPTITYTNDKTVPIAVIDIWEDLHNARTGYFRAFWIDQDELPNPRSGSPVIGYCSPGGSHKTIRAVVEELRRLGHRDPIYRNGRFVS